MKIHLAKKTLKILATGVLATLLVTALTGCTAAAFGKPSLALEVQSAVSSGNVNVNLVDGVAYLSGRVDSYYDSLAAERAAARYQGVDQVVNHIYVIR